jgi:hypothetical protein
MFASVVYVPLTVGVLGSCERSSTFTVGLTKEMQKRSASAGSGVHALGGGLSGSSSGAPSAAVRRLARLRVIWLGASTEPLVTWTTASPRALGTNAYVVPFGAVKIPSAFDPLTPCGAGEGVAEGVASGVAEGVTSGVADGVASGVVEGDANGVADGDPSGVADGVASGVVEGDARGVADGDASGVADGAGSEGEPPPPHAERMTTAASAVEKKTAWEQINERGEECT